MSYYNNLCETWDVTNAYSPNEFKDSRLRWYDGDDSIREVRNLAYRILLCPTLADATQKVDTLFDRMPMFNPTHAKVLRAIAGTLAHSNEQNWKINLKLLYGTILK